MLLGARGVGKTHLAAAHARGRRGTVVRVVADDAANVVSALVEAARTGGFDVSGEVVTMHRLNRRVVFDRTRRNGRLPDIARAAVATLTGATRASTWSTTSPARGR